MRSIDEIIRNYEQLINPDNTALETLIQNTMPDVIEGFVEFYGEDSREEIIERFSKIKIIFPVLDMHKVFEDILFSQLNQYMKEKFPNEYEKFYSSNIGGSTSRINKSQEYINSLDEICKKIAPYQEMDSRYSELKKLLEQKAREEHETKFNEFISQTLIDELNYTEEMANKNFYNLASGDVYDNFSRFVEGQFYNINTPKELIGNILNLRRLGINIPPPTNETQLLLYGCDNDTFQTAKAEFISLINNPDISRYIPSEKVAKKILNKYYFLMGTIQSRVGDELANQFYGAKYDFSNYLGVEQAILPLYDSLAAVQPALINNPNKREVGFIIGFNKFLFDPKTFGSVLIHESNHALETIIIDNGETYIIKSGWQRAQARDSISHKFVEDDDVLSDASIELLNECINELITLDILNIIRKKTNNIAFNDINDGCTYANAFFVVEEFYQLYKPEIIESRKNHNMDALYQKIGYENFEALANLMRKVSNKLYNGEFRYKRAMKNLESGIKNDETKFLEDVMKQRDQILSNMRRYSEVPHKNKGNITINSIIILMSILILIYITIIIFYK